MFARPAFLALLLAVATVARAEDETGATTPDPTPDATATATDGDADDGGDLPPVVRQVGEVTVVTGRSERDNLEVAGNVTVLNREQIEQSGAKDVPDLLRREAGIFVNNTTGTPRGYTVEGRGFNNGGGNGGRTLVLVDGRRINEVSSSVPDWSFVPMDNVEKIEVVRGPASATWGDNAMASVISITTRTGRGEPVFDLRGSTGTYDTDAGSLFAGGSAGPVTASLFLDGYKTHGYRDRSTFRRKLGEMKLEFDLGERATLGFKAGYADNTRQLPGDLSREQMAENRRQEEPGGDRNSEKVRDRFFEGRFDMNVIEGVDVEVFGWYRRRNDRQAITDPFSNFFDTREAKSAGLTSQMVVDRTIGPMTNRLVIGFDLLQEKLDDDFVIQFPPFPDSIGSIRARRTIWGLFLQNDLNLTEDLILSAGLRRDRSKRRGKDRTDSRQVTVRQNEWSPKASLVWNFWDPVSLYASYARGFRIPNLDETFGAFGNAPLLKAEKSDTYELGIKARAEKISANLAVYTMTVHDEIYFNPTIGLFGANTNLDRTRHRGIEFSMNIRPVAWLEVYGSYTYDDTKITRDTATGLEGLTFPITPNHRGTAGTRLFLPFDVEMGVNANYVGSRYLLNDIENQREKLPKYAVYDAYAAWRPQVTERIRLGFRGAIRNLTNRRYTEVGGVSPFSGLTGFFPSPDRNYEVGMSIEITP